MSLEGSGMRLQPATQWPNRLLSPDECPLILHLHFSLAVARAARSATNALPNRSQCLIATAGIVSGQAGGLYTAVVYVPAKSFKITKGTPCFYDTPSEAMGHNKRAFCAKCGSRLFGGI